MVTGLRQNFYECPRLGRWNIGGERNLLLGSDGPSWKRCALGASWDGSVVAGKTEFLQARSLCCLHCSCCWPLSVFYFNFGNLPWIAEMFDSLTPASVNPSTNLMARPSRFMERSVNSAAAPPPAQLEPRALRESRQRSGRSDSGTMEPPGKQQGRGSAHRREN